MKNRGLSQHLCTEFDMPLLPALFFHSDHVTMAARLCAFQADSSLPCGCTCHMFPQVNMLAMSAHYHATHTEQNLPTPIKLLVRFLVFNS